MENPRNPSTDAETLAMLRLYVLTVEKKTLEIWVNDQKGLCLNELVTAYRTFLHELSELGKNCITTPRPTGDPECRDGYEPCQDGVCRAWCS